MLEMLTVQEERAHNSICSHLGWDVLVLTCVWIHPHASECCVYQSTGRRGMATCADNRTMALESL